MAFDFQAYRNPYVSTIAELLSRGEDAKAKALVDVANAQARAAEIRGQAYGGAVADVGKIASTAITAYNDPKARQQRELDRGQAILKARGQEQQPNDRQRVMLGEVVPARTDVEYRQRPVDDGMSRPFGNIQFGARRGPNASTDETFALGVPSPDGSTIEKMSPEGEATVQRGLARADAFGLNPRPDTQDDRMSQLLQGSLGTSEVRHVPASRMPSRIETVTGPSVGRYTTPEGLYDVPKAYNDLIRAGISQQVATALAGQGQQANSIFDEFDKQKKDYGKSQVAVHGAIANMALQLADAQPRLSLEEALQSVIGPAGPRVDPKDIDALGVAMFGKSDAEKRQMLESLVKQWDAQGPRQVVNPGDSLIGASGRIQQIGQRPVTAADQLLMQNRNDYAEAVKSGYTGPYAKWLAEQSRASDKLTPAEFETARHNKELERIAALTQGRAAAAQAETARHNKAMELNPTGNQSEWKPGKDDNNKLVMYRTVNGKMETTAPPAGLTATGTPQTTQNVSAQGKAVLRSTDVAEPMMAELIADMEKALPGINDPKLNAKYNSLSSKAGALADWTKYSLGFEGTNTPQIQISKLLQAVQAGQYMTSSRNIRMLDLVLSHLSDPKQTPLRQYEALKNLESIMPAIRAAVLKAEQPINLNDPVENEPSIDDSFAAYLKRQEAANAGR